MKRTKFLALALVVAIMMMGAGYAYWSETLTIENTVKTGKLDFTFNDAGIVAVDTYMDRTATSTCGVNSSDDNQVDVVLEDMYPGAEATIKFDLQNTGTMKAIVKNFTVSDFTQKPYILVSSVKYDGSELISSGTASISLDTLATTLDNAAIAIEPELEKSFEITFLVDPNATESEVAENLGGTGGAAIQFSITADGLQYNDDVN